MSELNFNRPITSENHHQRQQQQPSESMPKGRDCTEAHACSSGVFKRMAVQQPPRSVCPLVVPADLSLPASRKRPGDLAMWTLRNLSEARENGPVNYTNWPRVSQLVFSPSYARSDGWGEAIRANQHPARCSRFLLLEDNMLNSGFGMDIKLISVALLIAVSQQRVLLHVPGVERLYVHFTNVSSGRWCDRPPYTLDCMWKPLTHCNPPPVNEET